MSAYFRLVQEQNVVRLEGLDELRAIFATFSGAVVGTAAQLAQQIEDGDDAEAQARAAAVQTLQQADQTEALARQQVQTNLSAEVANRQNGDAAQTAARAADFDALDIVLDAAFADVDADRIAGDAAEATARSIAIAAGDAQVADSANSIDLRRARPMVGIYGRQDAFGIVKEATGQLPVAIDADGNLDLESIRATWNGGRIPLLEDANGGVVIDSDGEDAVSWLIVPGAQRLPITGGLAPTEYRTDGLAFEVLEGIDPVTGAHCRPAAEFEPVFTTELALGRRNLFVTMVDRDTFAPTRRQVTYAQDRDVTALSLLEPHRVQAATGVGRYPVGAARLRTRLLTGAGKVYVVAIHGQSVSVGASDGPVFQPPEVVVTAAAPMASRVFCYNGGTFPHQLGPGPSGRTVAIDANRFNALVPAREGLNALRVSESMAMGLVETIARAHDDDAIFVVISFGHGSSDFGDIIGTAPTKAQPLINFETMLQKLVTEAAAANNAAFAPIWGRSVEVIADAMNGHEAAYSASQANAEARMGLLRTRVDGWKAITGQTTTIPIVMYQPASPSAATSPATMNPWNLASDAYVSTHLTDAMLVTQYWGDIGDYATVHPPAAQHRLIGEAGGEAVVRWLYDRRAPHLRIVSASIAANVVTATLSEPAQYDRYGVEPVAGDGLYFVDSAGELIPTGTAISADGMTLTVTLPSAPAGTTPTLRTGKGAKDFGSNTYGMGRTFGLRTVIRAIEPVGFSQTTAQPIFNWLAFQSIAIV